MKEEERCLLRSDEKQQGGDVLGEKDMTQKSLEAFNDVFADIVNGLLFQGEQVISETSLTDAQPLSMYKADGKLHEQERDVAKYWNMAASAGRGDQLFPQ